MAYNALYSPQSRVRIADAQVLRQYMRPRYKLHHPVENEWLRYAGESHQVVSAGMYFGGDIVYVLDGLPGKVWREECLVADQ
jgi:hypothetical protein